MGSILLGAGIYQVAGNKGTKAIRQFFQWHPLSLVAAHPPVFSSFFSAPTASFQCHNFKIMSQKSRNILGWMLAGLLSLLLAASAADKISGSAHSLQIGSSFGLSPETYRLLGLLEAASVLLFLWPRTGILGTLLLSSYLGGAIATHLQHQQGVLFPAGIEAFVWITAVVRFPELTQRLRSQRPAAGS